MTRSIPEDENCCQPGSPPPPPPAQPEAPSAWPVGLCIAVGVLCAGTVIAIIFVALLLRQVLSKDAEAQHEAPTVVPPEPLRQCAGEEVANVPIIAGEEEEASPSVHYPSLDVLVPAPTLFEPLPPPVVARPERPAPAHQDQLYVYVKGRNQWRQGAVPASAAASGSATDQSVRREAILA
ncbi:hypothetical protein ACP4OV_009127 [Aristida adscensionis]